MGRAAPIPLLQDQVVRDQADAERAIYQLLGEVDPLTVELNQNAAWRTKLDDALSRLQELAAEVRPNALDGDPGAALAYLQAGMRLAPQLLGVEELDHEALAAELCELSLSTGLYVHATAQLLAWFLSYDPSRAVQLEEVLDGAILDEPEGPGAHLTHLFRAQICASRRDIAGLQAHTARAAELLDGPLADSRSAADGRALIATHRAELESLLGRPELGLVELAIHGGDDRVLRPDTILERDLTRCRLLHAAGEEAEFERTAERVMAFATALDVAPYATQRLERLRAQFHIARARVDHDQAGPAADRIESLLAGATSLWPVERQGLLQLQFVALVLADRLADAEKVLAKFEETASPRESVMLRSRLDRARAERDGTALPPDDGELLRAYDDFLAEWRARPLPPGGIAPLHFAQQGELISEVLLRGLAARPGEAGVAWALRQVIRAQELGSGRRVAGSGWSTEGQSDSAVLERVRELVPPRGAMLVLLSTVERSHLFVVEPGHIEHLSGPPFEVLHAMAMDFYEELVELPPVGTPAEEFPGSASRLLVRELFTSELRERMRSWKQLTLVGFDQLGPFPAELLDVDGEELLGKSVGLTTLPSIPLGLALLDREAPGESLRDCIALVAPTAAELAELPLSAAQARRLASALPGEKTQLTHGEAATADAFARALDGARVVAAVVHGVRDWGLARPTGIALSDRRVFAGDLTMARPPELVILFACGVGAGDVRRGDDLRPNLAGALLERGVRTVIAAPADLEYQSALWMLEELSIALAEGASPAEAARRARCALTDHEDHAHPAFGWIEVLGLGHEPVFSNDADADR